MAIRDKLTAALGLSGPMCDDCLSSSTAVKPRQTVNKYCRDLAMLGKLTRQNQQCPKCKAWKVVNVMDEGKPSPNPRVVGKARSAARSWYWEGNIQDAIVKYLRKTGWEISRSADTTSREAGKDIEAKRGSRELWISVKGWPEKSVNTQARHWFAAALFDLVLYRTDNPSVDLAIGIPDGFSTYENLLPRIRWMRKKIPFNVFKVSESGDVSVLHPES